MVFNGDANNMDICTLADKPNKTNDTSFPLADKAMYANLALRAIFREIYQIYGGWNVIDTNSTDDVTAAVDLLDDGTQFYAFATADWILGADWVDENGDSFKLEPITLEEIRDRGYAEAEFMDTPGTPRFYRPVKNGIKIYPASNVAVTDGLLVHVGAQDIAPFTPSSTSTAPGYDSLAGHEAVADFMSFRFSDDNDKTNRDKRETAWLRGLAAISSHYKKKFREIKPAIRHKSMGSGFADQFVS